ncbi:hypothetical protein ACFV1B_08780 [Streptomyces sp. NPDC059637]|uniref:hypothetical protein n=1 Tax=Streptomyces sp. NPDC059637 TaxID=3347752 RepID=UPI0036928B36
MSAATDTAPRRDAAADAARTGRRVEEVLDRLAADGDRRACEAAEELVRVLMDFYGAGLARILALLDGDGGGAPAAPGGSPLDRLLGDELAGGLLALHGLHPEDVRTRIERALESAGSPLEAAGFDESTGTLRLRSSAAGCGCPGSTQAALRAVEDALACFAPEVTSVETEPRAAGPAEPPLLQITARPPDGAPGPGGTGERP